MSQPSAKVDTTAAEAYEQHMVPGMFVYWAELLVGIAAPRAGEAVLDVACGTGIGARTAARMLGGRSRVAGLDVDAGVIEVARSLSARSETSIEWHCASALEMPFKDAAFDLCLCFQGLQFFPDHVAGLTEIRRVLKPEGRLVASLWGPLESNAGHHAVVKALESQGVDAAPAKKACSLGNVEEIREIASRAGFTHIELKTYDSVSRFASVDSFIQGMTVGSPSTRHAVARLPEAGRARFAQDLHTTLAQYVKDGQLAYPMRSHVLVARH